MTSDEYKAQLSEALGKLAGVMALGFTFPMLGDYLPPGSVSLQGQTSTRVMYADVYAWATAQGLVKTENDWQTLKAAGGNVPWFSSGNGSTTLRFPYMPGNGMFVFGVTGSIGEATEEGIVAELGELGAELGEHGAELGELDAKVGALEGGSGFNAAGKAEIVGWGMPDYTSAVEHTWGTSHAAPSNGWIFVWRRTSGNDVSNSASVVIDGYEMPVQYYYNGQNYGSGGGGVLMPVGKGSVYATTGSAGTNNSFVFLPCKEV